MKLTGNATALELIRALPPDLANKILDWMIWDARNMGKDILIPSTRKAKFLGIATEAHAYLVPARRPYKRRNSKYWKSKRISTAKLNLTTNGKVERGDLLSKK